MAEFLKSQLDYIYFFYGLGFFLISAISFLSLSALSQKSYWKYLGLFGLFHGINEWLDLYALQYNPLPAALTIIRPCVLFLSFLFLFEFARLASSGYRKGSPGRWIYLPIITVIYFSYLSFGLGGFDVSCRYFLGFTGALWSGLIIFTVSAEQPKQIGNNLKVVAFCFILYAFSQLVVPYLNIFPASLINADNFFKTFSIPVQLIRGLLALVIAFFMWSAWYYAIYAKHKLMLLAKKSEIRIPVFILIIVLLCGWSLTDFFGNYTRDELNNQLITEASTAAAAINTERVLTLTGTSVDISSPHYKRIKEQLYNIYKVNSNVRFVYLLGLKDNKIIFLVDAEPEYSKDYSPPGLEYVELSSVLKEIFYSGETFIKGPYTDRWGSWVSAFIPVKNVGGSGVISILGFDINSKKWIASIYLSRALGIFITISIFVFLFSLFLIFAINKNSSLALVASEQNLSTTLFSIGDGVISVDADSKITLMNRVAESLTEWSLRDALGRNLEEVLNIINEKTRQRAESPVVKVLASGKIEGLANHTILISKSGKEYYLADSAAPIRSPSGYIIGVVLVFRDVTQFRKYEESRNRLAAIVEFSDDAIIGKKIDGTITSWNKGAEKIYGYPAQEMLGQSIYLLVPEDRHEEVRKFLEQVKFGEGVEHFQTKRLRKDGSIIDIALTVSPIKDENGEVVGASTIARDITESKKAEDKIKRLAEEWDNTFNSISDFIYILDKESRIIRVNKSFADLLKLAPGDIVGKKCYEILHKTAKPWPNCPHQQTILDHESHTETVEDHMVGAPLLVTTSPIFDEKGDFFGSVHIAKDISELRKREEQLKRAKEEIETRAQDLQKANENINALYKEVEEKNKQLSKLDQLKSDFVSMASHELRTPLAIIKEGVSLVLDKITGAINNEQEKTLKSVFVNVDRLARLLNDLLDMSKIEAGRVELKRALTDFAIFIKYTAEKWEAEAKKKAQQISVVVPEGQVNIYVDADKMTQVINNLISNAIKYTPEEGRIEVRLTDMADSIEVSVSDNGRGISEQDLPQVFDKFTQFGRPVGGAGSKGTGLGLTITKELISLHGGTIRVESQIGKGTSFIFTLPKVNP